jgi:rod shape-determining protein MreC
LSMKTVTAQVIGVAPDNYKWAVFIDRGRADGVRRDMAVVDPEGLVGKIVNVGPHQSTVLLMIDPQAAAASKIPSHLIKSSVPATTPTSTPTPTPSDSSLSSLITPTSTPTTAPSVPPKRFTKTVAGLVQGNGGSQDLSMTGVGGNETVHTGAKVVTDFYNGGIFPPGIPIGTVTSVSGDKRTLEQAIKVRPYVDYSNLDYVQILLETGRHPLHHGGA